MGKDPETGDAYQLLIQPIRDVHLDGRITEGRASNPIFSWVMGVIALMVLASGCINFINLSLGQAAARVKEVGVRKVMGAARLQLMGQFWSETVVLCLLALLVGIGLAELGLPYFNAFLRRDLSLDIAGSGALWAALLGLLLLTALLAGSYPALYLSRFRPVVILQGRLRQGGKGYLRKGLIVFQFVLAILLVTMMLTMNGQLHYLRDQDIGFDQEQVVVVPVSISEQDDAFVERYRQRLQTVPGVVEVAAASNALGQAPTGGRSTSILTFTHRDADIPAHLLRIDPSYLEALDLQLAWGRNFSDALPGDRQAVLINETMARRLSIQPGDAYPLDGFTVGATDAPTVIGVVEDFNFEPLRKPIAPLVMYMDPSTPFMRLFVRIRPDEAQATLAAMEAHWKELAPDLSFNHSFLDEDVDRQYLQEVRQIQVAGVATTLAMLIACFGLLGLAVLTGAQRTKEIGVRKVLGASALGLVMLLSKDFLRLVAVAFVLAVPLAWFNLDLWLAQFAYRVDLTPGVFLLAGAAVLLVAWLTVSYQAVRAALANPVDSRRDE
jgi:ABC-type antimicrobial peptide transport system permease subunit